MFSRFGMDGGRNPPPQFEGQCILGESGLPLVGARVHRRGRASSVQWRVAEVRCGLAYDGGLQDIVLHAFSASPTAVDVYVDDDIANKPDHISAIETTLKSTGRPYNLKSLKDNPNPPDGSIIIHVATEADAANAFYVQGQPTKTLFGYQIEQAMAMKSAPPGAYPGSWVGRPRYL